MYNIQKAISYIYQTWAKPGAALLTHVINKKTHFPKKLSFPENQTALTLLKKVPPWTTVLVQNIFCNSTTWKPMSQAFQKTFTFSQYIFNSRSNMHVNLFHWNSLHPKKAMLPTFSGQTPHFLGGSQIYTVSSKSS